MKTKVTFAKQQPAIVAWGVHTLPAGPMVIGVTPSGEVCRVSRAVGRPADVVRRWEREWPRTAFVKNEKEIAPAARQLAKTGQASALLAVGTEFQHKVWKSMMAIPYGKTASYSKVAARIGKQKAARAVGMACGANPVMLLVPCHRVIANDGSIGGFSSGLDLKKALLKAEGVSL